MVLADLTKCYKPKQFSVITDAHCFIKHTSALLVIIPRSNLPPPHLPDTQATQPFAHETFLAQIYAGVKS